MKCLLVRSVFVCTINLLTCAAFAGEADSRLEELMDRVWKAELAATPMSSNMFGYNEGRDQVDDLSDAAFQARAQRLDDALKALKTLDAKTLSTSNQVNYKVFEWMLRNERTTMEYDWRYIPFNTLGSWHTQFAQVVTAMPYSSEKDYRDLLKRMNGFEKLAEQNIALMENGIASGYVQPCEVLDGYADTISSYVSETPEESVFYSVFDNLPQGTDWAVKNELQDNAKAIISKEINPALERYLDFFTNTYQPACRKSIGLSEVPRGRELYAHFVKFYTTLDTNPKTVHELGLSEVARIQKEMRAIMNEVGFKGDFKAFREFLKTDPQFYLDDEEAYLSYVARITKLIDAKMPALFTTLPRNPYGISPVPAQTAPKTTTAYYQPGSLEGGRAGVYFVNTWNLPSRPLYELPALSLHEGVPGHHNQITIQQELPGIPAFRKQYYFHAFGEGWGLYSEKLGIEMGIYRTPYENFGRLIYEMWRACRLVVDTGMHEMGWTRQQAIDYMMANTGLTLHNITAEVDRYITYPGQALAYKHGELKFIELRQRAEQALGSHFSVREFHTAVLGNGSLPLVVLEELFDRWLAQQQNAAKTARG